MPVDKQADKLGVNDGMRAEIPDNQLKLRRRRIPAERAYNHQFGVRLVLRVAFTLAFPPVCGGNQQRHPCSGDGANCYQDIHDQIGVNVDTRNYQ
jgi:hypothetical protein